RSFGPEEYGLFSLATMVVILFVSLASLGIPEGLVRTIAFYRGRNKRTEIGVIVSRSLTLLFTISIIGGILLFLTAEIISRNIFHSEALIPFLKISAISIPFFILGNTYLAILRAYEKIVAYSIIMNIVQNGVKVGTLFLFIILGMRENTVMLSYLFGLIAMFLCAYSASKSLNIMSKEKIDLKRQKVIFSKMFSYAWPLSLLSLASFFLYWIDSFVIGYFMNSEAVGFYNAAVPIAALIMIAPDIIVQLFFPIVTKEYSKKNISVIEGASKQTTKWIFIANLPLTAILFIFPGAVINLLFGPEYLIAENALRLLAIGSLFGSLSIIPAHLISMTGRSKLMFFNILAMLILNLFLTIVLVPKYGINGAAFSTMIIFIAVSIIYFLQTRHILSFFPLRRRMLRVGLATILPVVLLSYLKLFFSLTWLVVLFFGVLFFILYLGAIILLKCLDEHDISLINEIKNKILQKLNIQKSTILQEV
ncbi:MAG: flippase, partial [Candidatus Staskawiczbacteria bacterium]|nr:flippase [Candidatus Staskawiczbacteria bacterium]